MKVKNITKIYILINKRYAFLLFEGFRLENEEKDITTAY